MQWHFLSATLELKNTNYELCFAQHSLAYALFLSSQKSNLLFFVGKYKETNTYCLSP